jgi:hypothetical protein
MGDVVKLTAVPNPGWCFSNWGGDANSMTNPVSITINGDQTITANYIQSKYTLFLPVIMAYGNGNMPAGDLPGTLSEAPGVKKGAADILPSLWPFRKR